MLALFARQSPRQLADFGFLGLNAMLTIYIGARLVSGSLQEILIEVFVASLAFILARIAMSDWLSSIGVAILFHGLYDALIGPHTGVVEWYPPLCAGFDAVAGLGLIMLLIRKERSIDNAL